MTCFSPAEGTTRHEAVCGEGNKIARVTMPGAWKGGGGRGPVWSRQALVMDADAAQRDTSGGRQRKETLLVPSAACPSQPPQPR